VEKTQFSEMASGRPWRVRARPDRSAFSGVLILAAKSIDRKPAQQRGIANANETHAQQSAADRAR